MIRCHLCRRPGAAWCPPGETVDCNFRARRRLGIPYAACLAYKARDLERMATEAEVVRGDLDQATILRAEARAWQFRADQEANRPPHVRAREYRAYLASPEWQALRSRAIERAGRRCEDEECDWVGGDLEVHHLTYERFGHEHLSDLIVLCPPCHRDWDDERREQAAKRASAYDRRVDGWARKVYGDDWETGRDFDEVAQEFDRWVEEREPPW